MLSSAMNTAGISFDKFIQHEVTLDPDGQQIGQEYCMTQVPDSQNIDPEYGHTQIQMPHPVESNIVSEEKLGNCQVAYNTNEEDHNGTQQKTSEFVYVPCTHQDQEDISTEEVNNMDEDIDVELLSDDETSCHHTDKVQYTRSKDKNVLPEENDMDEILNVVSLSDDEDSCRRTDEVQYTWSKDKLTELKIGGEKDGQRSDVQNEKLNVRRRDDTLMLPLSAPKKYDVGKSKGLETLSRDGDQCHGKKYCTKSDGDVSQPVTSKSGNTSG